MTDLGCLGLIQSQFRLFWSVSAAGRYDLIQSIWPESSQIGANRSRVGMNPKKKKKKKKLRRSINARAVVPVAAPRVGLWCGTLPVALVLPSCSLVDHINGLPGKASPLENWLYCYYLLVLTLLILDQICVLLSS